MCSERGRESGVSEYQSDALAPQSRSQRQSLLNRRDMCVPLALLTAPQMDTETKTRLMLARPGQLVSVVTSLSITESHGRQSPSVPFAPKAGSVATLSVG